MFSRTTLTLFIILLILSCGKNEKTVQELSFDSFANWIDPNLRLSSKNIKEAIHSQQKKANRNMYSDEYVRKFYSDTTDFIWITPSGISDKADTLISFLQTTENEGLPKNIFRTDKLESNLERIRNLDYKGTTNGISQLLGETEYLLTQAYIRYICGETFGYLRPNIIFNKLEKADKKPKTPFTQLYDIATEKADSTFAKEAIERLKTDNISYYLQAQQNKDELYMRLSQLFRETTDTTQRNRIVANKERCRWKTEKPKDKYVWVNLAAMQLYAIDHKKGDSIEMKICGGTTKHKSPQLISKIERIDMNPYWNIPFNIIKKEIAPSHAQDTAYFSRNRYRIIEKGSGTELNPIDVTKKMLLSGDYRIRQDNGDGNSLGRLIFRFPNNFAVFLHDTNNKSAFRRERRTVSHGCIRVERPLDLAIFLLDEPDEEEIDKIRVAIGLPPLIEETTTDTTENVKPKLGVKSVEPKVPVFITYYTLYPNLKDELMTYPDLYGYDEVILQKLLSY